MRSFFVFVALVCFCATAAFAQEPIKIGAVFSVTGAASFLGQPEKDSVLLAAEKINSQGGVLGRPLEMIIYDDETDVNKCVLAVDKLVRKDGVVAVIGPTTSGNTLAVTTKMEQYKVPLISCAAADKIVIPVLPWVFKVAPSDRFAAQRILNYIQTQGGKNLAILTVSDGFGQAGREVLKELIPAMGFNLAADEIYGPKDTDMTAQRPKLKGLNPDAIICWGTNPGPAVVSRNRTQLGITIPLYQSHGVASKKFIELAGESSEGLMLPAGRLIVAEQVPQGHPQKDFLMEYKKLYTEKTGQDVSTFGGHGWDATFLLAQAIAKAGSIEAEKIRAEVEKVTGFVGTAGIFNYSANDHGGLDQSAFEMVKIEKGDWKIIQ